MDININSITTLVELNSSLQTMVQSLSIHCEAEQEVKQSEPLIQITLEPSGQFKVISKAETETTSSSAQHTTDQKIIDANGVAKSLFGANPVNPKFVSVLQQFSNRAQMLKIADLKSKGAQKYAGLKAQLQAKAEECKQQGARIKTLEKKLVEKEDAIKLLAEHLGKVKINTQAEHQEELSAVRKSMQAALNTSEKQCEQLKSQIAEHKEAAATANKGVLALKEQLISAHKAQISQIKQKHSKQVEKIQGKNEELRAECVLLSQKNELLTKNNALVKLKLSTLNESISKKSSNIQRLRAQQCCLKELSTNIYAIFNLAGQAGKVTSCMDESDVPPFYELLKDCFAPIGIKGLEDLKEEGGNSKEIETRAKELIIDYFKTTGALSEDATTGLLRNMQESYASTIKSGRKEHELQVVKGDCLNLKGQLDEISQGIAKQEDLVERQNSEIRLLTERRDHAISQLERAQGDLAQSQSACTELRQRIISLDRCKSRATKDFREKELMLKQEFREAEVGFLIQIDGLERKQEEHQLVTKIYTQARKFQRSGSNDLEELKGLVRSLEARKDNLPAEGSLPSNNAYDLYIAIVGEKISSIQEETAISQRLTTLKEKLGSSEQLVMRLRAQQKQETALRDQMDEEIKAVMKEQRKLKGLAATHKTLPGKCRVLEQENQALQEQNKALAAQLLTKGEIDSNELLLAHQRAKIAEAFADTTQEAPLEHDQDIETYLAMLSGLLSSDLVTIESTYSSIKEQLGKIDSDHPKYIILQNLKGIIKKAIEDKKKYDTVQQQLSEHSDSIDAINILFKTMRSASNSADTEELKRVASSLKDCQLEIGPEHPQYQTVNTLYLQTLEEIRLEGLLADFIEIEGHGVSKADVEAWYNETFKDELGGAHSYPPAAQSEQSDTTHEQLDEVSDYAGPLQYTEL